MLAVFLWPILEVCFRPRPNFDEVLYYHIWFLPWQGHVPQFGMQGLSLFAASRVMYAADYSTARGNTAWYLLLVFLAEEDIQS